MSTCNCLCNCTTSKCSKFLCCQRVTIKSANFLLSGVLWTGALLAWIKNMTREQINPFTWADCKLMHPIFFFCSQYSSCLLMVMAVEKYFALYFPLQTKSICTVRNAKKISLVVAIALFAFNAQLFFIRESKKDSNGLKQCIWIRVNQGIFAN